MDLSSRPQMAPQDGSHRLENARDSTEERALPLQTAVSATSTLTSLEVGCLQLLLLQPIGNEYLEHMVRYLSFILEAP